MGTITEIPAESTTDINMKSSTSSGDVADPLLIARLWRDCNPVTSAKKTRLRTFLESATVKVFGFEKELKHLKFDAEVPCDQLEGLTGTLPTTLPGGLPLGNGKLNL